jgi:threonylcarbamoyladenosine tRNA methylthiotransferase MtaB
MFSFFIHTLGCKLNQLESEALADAFRREGFVLLPWGSDEPGSPDINGAGDGGDSISGSLLVINTCTVTSMAEQKARRMIRKSLREHPHACLIVTGCYAQLEKDALEALDSGRDGCKRLFVVPGDSKSALLELPRFLATSCSFVAGAESEPGELGSLIADWISARETGAAAKVTAGTEAAIGAEAAATTAGTVTAAAFRFVPGDFSSHSRGFLKIQDGCDKHCSYCRVTLARGPSVSLSAEKALADLKALEEKGYGEAVLTGVNISQYRDESSRDLGELLEYLLAGSARICIRLSSLEPDGLSRRLARILAHPRIRPHFHLSVQSGSPFILGRMGRSYGPDEVEEGAALLRSIKADPFLACDIITGFPGESAAEFEKTFELCQRIGFAWIHAFPYSRRPGTAAWSFKKVVSEREAAERVAALLNLAKQGRREYISRWIGKDVEAIVESGDENAPHVQATSENYLKLQVFSPVAGTIGLQSRCRFPEGNSGFQPRCIFPREAPAPGTLLRCRIKGLPEGSPASSAPYPQGQLLQVPETGRFDAAAEIVEPTLSFGS